MLTFLCYVLVWTTARPTYTVDALRDQRTTRKRGPHGSAGHTQAARQQGSADHTQAGRSARAAANVQQGGAGHTQAGRSARPTYNKEARVTHRLDAGRTPLRRTTYDARDHVRTHVRGSSYDASYHFGRTHVLGTGTSGKHDVHVEGCWTNGITLDGRTYEGQGNPGSTTCTWRDAGHARTRDRDIREARRARGGMLERTTYDAGTQEARTWKGCWTHTAYDANASSAIRPYEHRNARPVANCADCAAFQAKRPVCITVRTAQAIHHATPREAIFAQDVGKTRRYSTRSGGCIARKTW